MSPPPPSSSSPPSAAARCLSHLAEIAGDLGAVAVLAEPRDGGWRVDAGTLEVLLDAAELGDARAVSRAVGGAQVEAFRVDGAGRAWVALVIPVSQRSLSDVERRLITELARACGRSEREEAWRHQIGETGFVCDGDMGISLAMPEALAMVGLPEDAAVVGRPLADVLPGWRLKRLEPGETARGHHRGLGRSWVCHPARPGPDGAPRQAIRFQEPEVRALQSGPQHDFLQALRHDVRSPLTALRGLVSVLIDEPEMPVDERQQLLELLRGESERIVNFVEDYLVAMRLRISPEPQQARSSDLRTSVSQYLSELEGHARTRRIRLTTSLEEAIVEVDVPLVDAFVRNVIGAVFRMADAGAEIHVALGPDGLDVRGAGPGQFRQLLDRPFTTLARSTSSGKRTPGAALGLFLAKKIADAHGWRVSLGPDGDGFAVRVEFA